MRHGLALPVGGEIKSDAERPLSPEGRGGVRSVASSFEKSGVHPARVLSSPLKRAVETANLMLSCAKPGIIVEEKSVLFPGSSVQKVWKLLAEKPDVESVLVVGHQPDLGFMLQILFANRVPEELEAFPAAQVCAFTVTDLSSPSASFLWTRKPA